MNNSLTSNRFCLTARQKAFVNIIVDIIKRIKTEEKAKNEQKSKDAKE